MSDDFPRDSNGLRSPLVSRRRDQDFRCFLNDYRDFQSDYVSRREPINPDQRIGHGLLRGPRHPRPQPRLSVVVRVAPVPFRAVPPVPLLLAPLTAAHRLPRSHPHVGLEPPATDSTGPLACHSPSTSPTRPASLTPHHSRSPRGGSFLVSRGGSFLASATGHGILGLLHAIAVAPSMMPPSRWLPAALPDQALAAADGLRATHRPVAPLPQRRGGGPRRAAHQNAARGGRGRVRTLRRRVRGRRHARSGVAR
jgi:hypothetical protein